VQAVRGGEVGCVTGSVAQVGGELVVETGDVAGIRRQVAEVIVVQGHELPAWPAGIGMVEVEFADLELSGPRIGLGG